MASRRRQEGGKKQNAEGMHGDLTHKAIQEQLKHKLTTEPVAADEPGGPAAAGIGGERGHQALGAAGDKGGSGSLKAHAPGPDGKHRLREDRQQHDEADKNSEKNRAAKETGGHSGEIK